MAFVLGSNFTLNSFKKGEYSLPELDLEHLDPAIINLYLNMSTSSTLALRVPSTFIPPDTTDLNMVIFVLTKTKKIVSKRTLPSDVDEDQPPSKKFTPAPSSNEESDDSMESQLEEDEDEDAEDSDFVADPSPPPPSKSASSLAPSKPVSISSDTDEELAPSPPRLSTAAKGKGRATLPSEPTGFVFSNPQDREELIRLTLEMERSSKAFHQFLKKMLHM